MALTAFTGTISATVLNGNFDDKTTTITGLMDDGAKDQTRHLYLTSVTDLTAASLRSFAWTQPDDQELRIIMIRATDGTASRVVTATLEVDNGDTTYLVDNTISASATTIIGTSDTRTDYRTVTGTRARLLKGVRYRLTIANTSAGTTITGPIIAAVQLRTVRRQS